MSTFNEKLALIIDDDRVSIKVLKGLLNQVEVPSIEIVDSYNVDQLINTIEVPDIVFLDLEMPRNNGYGVLELIRNDERFEGVPVVAYTTHISHLNNARQAGFDGFLGKPIDGERFPDNLAKILNGIPVWEA